MGRNRTLIVSRLVVLIINFKSTIQRELDSFFEILSGDQFIGRMVTKGAFTKARAKLSYRIFKCICDIVVAQFYKDAPYLTWHGRRILGVDGTRIQLPNDKSVIEEFGQHHCGPNADSPCSIATASVMYDCLNLVPIDSQIAPFKTGESKLLLEHLPYVKEGDILVMDRGYPSFWLLFLLTARKIDFCIRLKSSWWIKVKAFAESSKTEDTVTFTLPKKDWDKLKEYPEIRDKVLTFRLIKVLLPTEKTEILCTSLLDQESYPKEEFGGLYHMRWNEEEGYKLFKSRIRVEQFSGKTALAVKQDFHAKILLMTLAAVYSYPIEQRIRKEYKPGKKRKRAQKINRTNSLAAMLKTTIPMFLKKIVRKALACFDELVFKTREIIRPNRSNPRNHRQQKSYYMSYKPL